ncbi:MAG: hypothetical protein HY321_18555 [Armatimonadetes bacterium]|nr:hypothetical protein [Armatimonadota bacterium]
MTGSLPDEPNLPVEAPDRGGCPPGAASAGPEDPVALVAGWSPLRTGAMSIRTHRLVRVTPGRMEFRSEWAARGFAAAFVVGFGAGAIAPWLIAASSEEPAWSVAVFRIACSAVCGAIALGFAALCYGLMRPIVFDTHAGVFRKGWRPPRRGNLARPPSAAPLAQVHALQLLASRGDEFTSYELNLVLKDGRRIGLVNHGDGDRLQADARALARFLGVRVWDGTRGPVDWGEEPAAAGEPADVCGIPDAAGGIAALRRGPKRTLLCGAALLAAASGTVLTGRWALRPRVDPGFYSAGSPYPYVDIRLRRGEIEILGRIRGADATGRRLAIEAERFNRYNLWGRVRLRPFPSPRRMVLRVGPETALHVRGREALTFEDFQPGRYVFAIARNRGPGEELPAREVALWSSPPRQSRRHPEAGSDGTGGKRAGVPRGGEGGTVLP